MKSILGIDIGSRYIKVIRLNSISPIQIEDIVIFDTPYTIVEEKEQIDQEKISELLSQKLSKDLINSEIITSIPSGLIKSIHLTLPPIPKKELNDVVVREARAQIIPSPPEDSVFEYLILEQKEQLKLFIASTQKRNIDKLISLCNKIKIIPSIITFTSFAHIKAISTVKIDASEIAFIDIGASSSTISIFKQNDLQIFRNLHPLFSSLVYTVSKQFNLTREKAEECLIKFGIPEAGVDFRKDERFIKEQIEKESQERLEEKETENINLLQLRLIIQPYFKIFISEIERTILYYKERFGGGDVTRILLSGGGAGLKNIDKFLSANMRQEIEIFDPFKNINIEKISDKLGKFPSCIFTTALGLSLQKKNETINFLPKEYRKVEISNLVKYLNIIILGVVGFSLLGLGFGFWNLHTTKMRNIKLYEKNQAILDTFKPYLKMDREISERKKKLSDKTSILNEVIEFNLDWYGVLKELTILLPEEIVLTDLSIKRVDKERIGRQAVGRDRGMMEGGYSERGGMSGYMTENRGKDEQQSSWEMEISGFVIADYQTTWQILNEMDSNFNQSYYFKIIELSGPKLEKISVSIEKDERDIELTERKKRNFEVRVEINPVR